MALIADSGGIYGLYDASERRHRAIRAAFEAERGVVIIPMPVLIDDVRAGAFALEPCTLEDLQRSRALIETYRDLDLGLADACVIACAERLQTLRVLTVDERHFRVVRTVLGKPLILIILMELTPFILLIPADASERRRAEQKLRHGWRRAGDLETGSPAPGRFTVSRDGKTRVYTRRDQ